MRNKPMVSVSFFLDQVMFAFFLLTFSDQIVKTRVETVDVLK